jgi:hypothetical protein
MLFEECILRCNYVIMADANRANEVATLHIIQGGIQNGDREWLVKAARQNLTAPRWIVPKQAQSGDEVVIYVGTTFFATARIIGRTVRWPQRGRHAYRAGLNSIQLIEPPISLDVIRKEIPGLKWAIYPRSITTPRSEVASKVRQLIQRIRNSNHFADDDRAADVGLIVRDRRLKETSKTTMIEARLGQGDFRADLMKRWNGVCAVTGCAVPEVLRASHIKPWKNSRNKERLDPANGLLLSANIDALFDSGLITFGRDGRMLVSKSVPTRERKRLGLPRKLSRVPDRSERAYLKEHRASKFRG